MSSDFDNVNDSGNIDTNIAELRAELGLLKQKTSGFDAGSYKRLSEKYEKAMEVIELQKTQLEEYKRNKLPTKDEVDTISSMLDLISKLDDNTMQKIEKFGKKNG